MFSAWLQAMINSPVAAKKSRRASAVLEVMENENQPDETAERRDDVVRRMLATPPAPREKPSRSPDLVPYAGKEHKRGDKRRG